MFEIEKIMEDLVERGLPEHLVGEVETLIVNEHCNANRWKRKYEEIKNYQSWEKYPDMMGK